MPSEPDRVERSQMLGRLWADKAEENVKKWGNQRPIGLLLAMAEELAEIADELLDPDDLTTADTTAQLHLQAIRRAGFESREYLESECEDADGNPLPIDERPELGGVGDAEAAIEETHDLAPLCWQLIWALQEEKEDGGCE